MKKNWICNNRQQQQKQPLTSEQKFEMMMKKFLKVSAEKHQDLKKIIDRHIKDNRYKFTRKAGE